MSIVLDAMRCSAIAMHAPLALKACLPLAPTDVVVSYDALRDKIFTYFSRGYAYGDEGQPLGMPMNVNVVEPSLSARIDKGANTRQQAEGWRMRAPLWRNSHGLG